MVFFDFVSLLHSLSTMRLVLDVSEVAAAVQGNHAMPTAWEVPPSLRELNIWLWHRGREPIGLQTTVALLEWLFSFLGATQCRFTLKSLTVRGFVPLHQAVVDTFALASGVFLL